MAETARLGPQRIRVSSKRQITIPAKAYKSMGFSEYALIEQTDEGLLIKPLHVDDERMSLTVLRRLIAEGYEGEELLERYAQVCPRVIRFSDLSDDVAPENEPAGEVESAEEARSRERERIFEAVSAECERFPGIARGYIFGSFARGDFVESSDVDVRIEFDEGAVFSLRDLGHFCKHLERITGRSVDVVNARKIKNPNLASTIEREKVLVYERQGN
ncbi:MAG: hypothetical protein HFJ66_02140 [Eggerthellaceae bacterium]|nr:hypothetical protein [Eggerthellaceae bacterium]